MSTQHQSPTASASGASSNTGGRPSTTSVLARVAARNEQERKERKPVPAKKPATAAPAAAGGGQAESRSGHGIEESFRHEAMDKEMCDCGRKMTAQRGADNVALRYCPECDHCAPGDDADFAA